MTKKLVGPIGFWLLHGLQLQLFLTLISLPLLAYWGLPFSFLTIAGNLLLTPFIAIFLLLSSCIFFTELAHIPNGVLYIALEATTSCWLNIMKLPSNQFLTGMAQPPALMLIVIPATAVMLLHCKKIQRASQRAGLFFIMLVLLFAGSKLTTRITAPAYQTVPCNNGQVTLLHDQGALTLIDPGVIGQRPSAPNWIEYTLIPQMLRSAGTTIFAQVIALQPSPLTFQALTMLMQKSIVKKLFVAPWQGTPSARWRSSWEQLKKTAREKNTAIEMLSNFNQEATAHLGRTVTTKNLESFFLRENLRVCAYSVTGCLGEKSFLIYPYAYERKTKNKLLTKKKNRGNRLSHAGKNKNTHEQKQDTLE